MKTIINIAINDGSIAVAYDDGSLWGRTNGEWYPIPQHFEADEEGET